MQKISKTLKQAVRYSKYVTGQMVNIQKINCISLKQQSMLENQLLSSINQSCLTLCNPIDCSTPGFPVLHQLLALVQSIKLVMPSNHLILCRPLLLLPSNFPSIRDFSNGSVLCISWPKYWNFIFSISPSNEYSGLISFRMTGLISLQSKGLSRVFSNTTVQKHQFFGTQLSLESNTHIHT